jgi:hypothetical protein
LLNLDNFGENEEQLKYLLNIFVSTDEHCLRLITIENSLINNEEILLDFSFYTCLENIFTSEVLLNAYKHVLDKDYNIKKIEIEKLVEKNLLFLKKVKNLRFCKFPQMNMNKEKENLDLNFLSSNEEEINDTIERKEEIKYSKDLYFSLMSFSECFFLEDQIYMNLLRVSKMTGKNKNLEYLLNVFCIAMSIINQALSEYLKSYFWNRNDISNFVDLYGLIVGNFGQLTESQVRFFLKAENWSGTHDSFKLRIYQS